MQRTEAIKTYRWLWFAPFLTVPTIIFLSIIFYFNFDNPFVGALIVSSAWHIILLIPVVLEEDEYLRWHGKQALVLAGLQTTVPLLYIISYRNGNMDEFDILGFIFPLAVVWLFGTLWGQGQAKKDVCSLMNWFGGDAYIEQEPAPIQVQPPKLNPDDLENVIRYSKDMKKRAGAVFGLMQLGMVESLDGSELPEIPSLNLEAPALAATQASNKSGGCSTAILWIGGILLILFIMCRLFIAF